MCLAKESSQNQKFWNSLDISGGLMLINLPLAGTLNTKFIEITPPFVHFARRCVRRIKGIAMEVILLTICRDSILIQHLS
jgi:hypothetical protein